MTWCLASGVSVVSLLAAIPGLASAATAADRETAVEEIVVTAQKRAERLQDVPISVTAVTAKTMEEKGVSTVLDLQRVTPGLTLTKESNLPQPFIRGIGTPNSGSFEAATATYVDGIYYYTPAATVFNLSNIERIEVLKGPQGTLFGRNATAGVINIITRQPSEETALDASVGYGRFEAFETKLYGTTRVADGLAADLALYWYNQAGGWGRNLFDGAPVFRERDFGVRTKWRWEPGADTSLTFSLDYSRSKSEVGAAGRVILPTLALDRLPAPADPYDVRMDNHPYGASEQTGGSVTLNQNLGDFRFVSLTAYRQDNAVGLVDQDQSTAPVVRAYNKLYNRTFTQEFQLHSPDDQWLKWIVGAFYLNTESRTEIPITGTAVGALAFRTTEAVQNTRSYSAFAQATGEVLPRTNLTIGGRYTIDTRNIVGQSRSNLSTTLFPEQKDTWKEPTWRISLDHKLAPDTLIFASYNRGFRAGSFNTTQPNTPSIEPEILDAYEAGIKSDLFDRRLRINASAYYYDIRNLQLNATITGTSSVYNAAAAELKGIEVWIDTAPVRNLTAQFAVAVMDGEYKDFPNAQFFRVNFPNGGSTAFVGDASGNRTLRTPKFTASAAFQYVVPTQVGDLRLAADSSYNDGYFADVQNQLPQKAYNVVNASIGWTSPGERYEARLWARNITGVHYFIRMGSTGQGFIVAPAEPATYGVTLTAHLR